MDLQLTEPQTMMVETAQAWLENEWPIQVAGAWLDGEQELPAGAWSEAAGLGWLGLGISEQNGGLGGDLVDLVVLQEALGKALFPSTYASTMVLARLLDRYGEAAPRQQWLPQLVTGAAIGTTAVAEQDGIFLSRNVQSRLTRNGAGWRLSGEKWFVRDAHIADYMAVLASVGNSSGAQELAWALVERRTPGITCSARLTSGRDRQYTVTFEDVELDATHVIHAGAGDGRSIDSCRAEAMILECGYLVGVSAQAHSMAVRYAAERVQFGRPIGSFQAIQHKVADMTTDLESSRLMALHAATRGATAAVLNEAIYAKLWISEAVQRIVREAQQIHGGLGYITEYPLFRFTRRAKTGELVCGAPFELLEYVADDVTGVSKEAQREPSTV